MTLLEFTEVGTIPDCSLNDEAKRGIAVQIFAYIAIRGPDSTIMITLPGKSRNKGLVRRSIDVKKAKVNLAPPISFE